jgi:hypothetical protein
VAVHYLVTPSEVRAGRLPEPARRYRDALEEVVRWVEEHLPADHPDLGRAGPVCPYVRPSLDNDLLWLTVHPGANPSLDRLASDAMHYGCWVRRHPVPARLAQFEALLILLPDLSPERGPEVIDVVQRALKPRFVDDGLMIGQFYPGCASPGLWNPRFRPLSSTVPLLTIRHMVAADPGFLGDDRRHLTAYLARYSDRIPSRFRDAVHEASVRLGVDER